MWLSGSMQWVTVFEENFYWSNRECLKAQCLALSCLLCTFSSLVRLSTNKVSVSIPMQTTLSSTSAPSHSSRSIHISWSTIYTKSKPRCQRRYWNSTAVQDANPWCLMTKSTFFIVKNISRLHSVVWFHDWNPDFHSLPLDYCNGLLTGVPVKTLEKLLNSYPKPWKHITPGLIQLHCLHVSSTSNIKSPPLRISSWPHPQYLPDLFQPYIPSWNLRYSDTGMLFIPALLSQPSGMFSFQVFVIPHPWVCSRTTAYTSLKMSLHIEFSISYLYNMYVFRCQHIYSQLFSLFVSLPSQSLSKLTKQASTSSTVKPYVWTWRLSRWLQRPSLSFSI